MTTLPNGMTDAQGVTARTNGEYGRSSAGASYAIEASHPPVRLRLNEPHPGVDVDRAAAALADLLDAFGVPRDEHTADTHNRSAKAWKEILAGYADDPRAHLSTTFPAAEDPGLVIVSGVKMQSMCAHHLLPFSGMATVAYRPTAGQSVVGLSKLARVLIGYARRLQVQENIGHDTVRAIMDTLKPQGAAVKITAFHDCMRLRGVKENSSVTTTLSSGGILQPHEWMAVESAHQAHVRDL